MGAFAAIQKAEQFFGKPDKKLESLQKSHMEGEYDDEPSMKSGRYDQNGRRYKDGRKRIQGYTTAQRYAQEAARQNEVNSAFNKMRGRK